MTREELQDLVARTSAKHMLSAIGEALRGGQGLDDPSAHVTAYGVPAPSRRKRLIEMRDRLSAPDSGALTQVWGLRAALEISDAAPHLLEQLGDPPAEEELD